MSDVPVGHRLFLVGASLQAALLLWILVTLVVERHLLAKFTRAAQQPQADATNQPALPGDLGAAGEALHAALRADASLDDGLSASFVALGAARLRPSILMALCLDALLALTALAPLMSSLLECATQIANAWRRPSDAQSPYDYVANLEMIPSAFGPVRDNASATAILAVSLAGVWATRWLFLRPEVREARVLRAFLRAASTARPRVNAARSAHLAKLMAPSLSLAAAGRAALGLVVMIALTRFILTEATDLRVANSKPLTFSRWPAHKVIGPPELRGSIPRYNAGTAPPPSVRASLIIGLDGVTLAQEKIAKLEDGALVGVDAPGGLDAVKAPLEAFRTKAGDAYLLVLSHREARAQVTLDLLVALARDHRVSKMHLVLERDLPVTTQDRRHPVQAALTLVPLHHGAPSPPIRLKISRRSVTAITSQDELTFRLSAKDWNKALSQVTRDATGFGRQSDAGSDPRVELQVEGDVSYDRFIAILAAADSACTTMEDCGLPGIGLTFALRLPKKTSETISGAR